MDSKPIVRPSTPSRSRRRLLLRMVFGAVALLMLLLLLASPALAPSSSFPDVPTSHPYYAAITDLAGRAIIGGYANGNFGPDDAVIRQQFAKMIVLTLGLPVSESDICPFSDVEEGAPGVLYPDHYVAVAAAHNITVGTSPGLFSPGISIKRAQVVTMVVRAAQNAAPGALSTLPLGYQGTLGDFDPTHAGNMKIAEYNDLLVGLQGFGTTWDPFALATRGEVAQILHNLLGKLPHGSVSVDVSVAKATSTIDAEGGRVELDDGSSLTIPAGALTQATDVGLEEFSTPRDFGEGATAYEITGLAGMAGKAELTFPAERGLTEEEVAVYSYDAETPAANDIPYTYDPTGGTVTVTIGSDRNALAALANTGLARAGASLKASGLVESLRVVFAPEEGYVPANAETLINTPFYEQSGGDCLAADAAMMIAGLIPAEEREHQGAILREMDASDSDFGLSGLGSGFQSLLPDYIERQTGATATVRGFASTQHLRWRLLRELDSGHPCICRLPQIDHWVLVVGYRRFGEELIIHDSKAVSPTGAIDGGMYTVRSYDWLRAQQGLPTTFMQLLWTDTRPSPESLLSLGCPGGDETGYWASGMAQFSFINPQTPDRTTSLATLQFRPSSLFGVRWHSTMTAVDVIPGRATRLDLSFPVWNARFQEQTADVKIRIYSGADRLFTSSQCSITLPAAGYDVTRSASIQASIPTEEFRNLSRATEAGTLPIEIDGLVMQGSDVADSFSVRATLSVVPVIDRVVPSDVAPGAEVTITGSCFGKDKSTKSAVTVGGKSVEIRSWSDTIIVLAIPQDAELRSNLPVIVTTGEAYAYQSNVGSLSISKQSSLKESYTKSDSNIEGVLTSQVTWELTGDSVILDSQDTDTQYYSVRVKKDTPFVLSVTATALLENPTKTFVYLKYPDEPLSEDNPVVGSSTMTYRQPTLYPPSIDWIMKKNGSFPAEIVSSSADSFTIEGMLTSYSQSLNVEVVFRVTYDSKVWDANGSIVTDVQGVHESDSYSGTIYIRAK